MSADRPQFPNAENTNQHSALFMISEQLRARPEVYIAGNKTFSQTEDLRKPIEIVEFYIAPINSVREPKNLRRFAKGLIKGIKPSKSLAPFIVEPNRMTSEPNGLYGIGCREYIEIMEQLIAQTHFRIEGLGPTPESTRLVNEILSKRQDEIITTPLKRRIKLFVYPNQTLATFVSENVIDGNDYRWLTEQSESSKRFISLPFYYASESNQE